MKHKPPVTISTPTYNSQDFIVKCLDAIEKQSYSQIEVVVVDGNSTDKTIELLRNYPSVKVVTYTEALLGARLQGVKQAKGEFVLLLDSDQILERDAVSRCVETIEKENLDMLVLEEGVYRTKTVIEKLFALDRKLIHRVADFSPQTGVMLPRFYRTKFLLKVFENIPDRICRQVGGQDHAIIYIEAWNISQKVGIVPNAVRHIEPDTVYKVWKKFYRWGKTSVGGRYGKYDAYLARKENFRRGMFRKGLITASVGSILLLLLKGIPYKLGYFSTRLKL